MGGIKSWKKLNDITWQNQITGALVQVVPTITTGFKDESRNNIRVYDVYVESRKPPIQRRVRIPWIKNKSDALRNAMTWMRKHPRG